MFLSPLYLFLSFSFVLDFFIYWDNYVKFVGFDSVKLF